MSSSISRSATPAQEQRLATFFDASQPRDTYNDAEIENIALLLRRCEPTAKSCARTYIVLRVSGHLDKLERLLDAGFSDAWFPVTEWGLPGFLEPRVKRDIVQCQSIIMTKSLSLENGKHCHFEAEESLPFEKLELLGRGGFGEVRIIESKITCKRYALKVIRRRAAYGNQMKQAIKDFLGEMWIMKSLDHQHLVRYISSYTDKHHLGLVMSPIADCDLAKYMRRACDSPDMRPTLRSFFGCLASALAYLHQKIKHRDIKPGNILVHNSNVLIADFGLARASLDTTSGPTPRTLRYCAPEVASQDKRNASADVWSLGCVFLEMLATLQGETLDGLVEYYGNAYTCSSQFSANAEATETLFQTWSRTCSGYDQLPLTWTRNMLRTNRHERPTASELVQTITDPGNPTDYCGLCCSTDDMSDSVGSLFDELEVTSDAPPLPAPKSNALLQVPAATERARRNVQPKNKSSSRPTSGTWNSHERADTAPKEVHVLPGLGLEAPIILTNSQREHTTENAPVDETEKKESSSRLASARDSMELITVKPAVHPADNPGDLKAAPKSGNKQAGNYIFGHFNNHGVQLAGNNFIVNGDHDFIRAQPSGNGSNAEQAPQTVKPTNDISGEIIDLSTLDLGPADYTKLTESLTHPNGSPERFAAVARTLGNRPIATIDIGTLSGTVEGISNSKQFLPSGQLKQKTALKTALKKERMSPKVENDAHTASIKTPGLTPTKSVPRNVKHKRAVSDVSANASSTSSKRDAGASHKDQSGAAIPPAKPNNLASKKSGLAQDIETFRQKQTRKSLTEEERLPGVWGLHLVLTVQYAAVDVPTVACDPNIDPVPVNLRIPRVVVTCVSFLRKHCFTPRCFQPKSSHSQSALAPVLANIRSTFDEYPDFGRNVDWSKDLRITDHLAEETLHSYLSYLPVLPLIPSGQTTQNLIHLVTSTAAVANNTPGIVDTIFFGLGKPNVDLMLYLLGFFRYVDAAYSNLDILEYRYGHIFINDERNPAGASSVFRYLVWRARSLLEASSLRGFLKAEKS